MSFSSLAFASLLFFVAAPRAVAGTVAIDSAAIVPSSLDTSGQPVLPYLISYGLRETSKVTLTVQDASGNPVRHLLTDQLQSDETVSTHTVVWDGAADSGRPVPVGVYTFVISATDPSGAPTVSQSLTFPVTTALASAGGSAKDFADGAYIKPNPVRDGNAAFVATAVRDNATITLKVYTLSGDLVLSQTLVAGASSGTVATWPAAGIGPLGNQSGHKLGRGLYFCVFRETDSQGTLQAVKKMAVIQ